MRELPLDKLNEVVEAFRVITLLSETIFEAAVIADSGGEQIAEDAAIIADRMAATIAILDEQYPGLKELIQQADRKAEARAKQVLAECAAQATRH